MSGEWIDIQALPRFRDGTRLVLFGAGNGSRELLTHLQETHAPARVVAVLDNDPTMHGRSFEGIPIHAPGDLPAIANDLVVVTTVSGREAVAAQLEAAGLVADTDFVLIGIYPHQSSLLALQLMARLHSRHGTIRSRLLHVGPGGFLGLECGLHALYGDIVRTLISIDAFSFNSTYPALGHNEPKYAMIRHSVMELAATLGVDAETAAKRWDELFHETGQGVRLDRDRIDLRMPHRYSSLPLDDSSMDTICSFQVLEHVLHPGQAVAETWRVLAPGGISVQHITTRDHRSLGAMRDYTPLSYRRYSEAEWQAITADKFHQNRIAPFQWKELFETQGFDILEYQVLRTYTPTEEERAAMHPEFRDWPPERQQEVDCVIVAAKPEAA